MVSINRLFCAALLGLSLWPSSVWAQSYCTQVYDREFAGTQCSLESGATTYSGTFTDTSGGTLAGTKLISYKTDGTYVILTSGKLRTHDFAGTLVRQEKRVTNTVAKLATTITETRTGRHRLDNGVLDGTSKLEDRIGSGYTLVRDGTITSTGFRGTLHHEERQDTANADCNTYLEVVETGEWSLPGAQYFKGTLKTVKSCSSSGQPVTQVIDNRVKFTP